MQELADNLARRIGRAVLIEDRRNRVMAYTEHTEPSDQMRGLTIMRRRRPAEAVAWLDSHGAYAAAQPVSVPECERLSMLPRVCVPLRHDGVPYGIMSFVGTLGPLELALAAEAAAEMAAELHRERLAAEYSCQREIEAVRALLLGEAPEIAASTLLEEEHLRPSARVTVLVVRQAEDRHTLAKALKATRGWFGPRDCLDLARHDHGVLLLTSNRRPAEECAAHLASLLRRPAVIGIGDSRQGLAQAGGSYDEALQACRVAETLPGVGSVAHWARLGVYRALSRFTADQALHPRLEALFADASKQPLLETLEAFLELAGNVNATAERLHLHRATLYYRLERIAQLTEANLKDGNERLSLHLALKVGRLTGRYVPVSGVAIPS